MIKENKASKYLLYAIGEILLVVIGILIALGINNWNEQKKANNTETEYYCRIIEDLDIDLENIDQLFSNVEDQIEKGKSLIIDLHSQKKDKNYLMNAYLKVVRTDGFYPSKAAFDDIKSSGNLNVLANLKVKNSLIRYYNDLDNITTKLSQNREQMVQRAFDYQYINEIGFQEFEYIKNSLGPQIMDLLPKVNWHLNKEHKYFKQFEADLVLFIALKEREKQFYNRIRTEMKPLYDSLQNLCVE
jgi:predicted  nucleic acid-binding Zn-ribbon protein